MSPVLQVYCKSFALFSLLGIGGFVIRVHDLTYLHENIFLGIQFYSKYVEPHFTNMTKYTFRLFSKFAREWLSHPILSTRIILFLKPGPNPLIPLGPEATRAIWKWGLLYKLDLKTFCSLHKEIINNSTKITILIIFSELILIFYL